MACADLDDLPTCSNNRERFIGPRHAPVLRHIRVALLCCSAIIWQAVGECGGRLFELLAQAGVLRARSRTRTTALHVECTTRDFGARSSCINGWCCGAQQLGQLHSLCRTSLAQFADGRIGHELWKERRVRVLVENGGRTANAHARGGGPQ